MLIPSDNLNPCLYKTCEMHRASRAFCPRWAFYGKNYLNLYNLTKQQPTVNLFICKSQNYTALSRNAPVHLN